MKAWLTCLIVSILLLGCGALPQPPLRVGVSPWVGYDPLVLARERGLLAPDRVRLVELPSNSESDRALRNGLLDAAALTLDEALRLAHSGIGLKLVAVLDVSHGADAVVALPGIRDLSQLRGKRIALEQTAVGALVLDHLLEAAGLAPTDVELLHVEASEHDAVLSGGRADVVITYEPLKSRLTARGNTILYDSRRMPGGIVDVLVARADADPARLAELLAAWERGLRALLSEPEDAAALLAPGVDLSPAQYLATLDGLDFVPLAESARRLAGSPAPLSHQAAGLTRTLLRLGLIRRPPDWSSLIDTRPAARAISIVEAHR